MVKQPSSEALTEARGLCISYIKLAHDMATYTPTIGWPQHENGEALKHRLEVWKEYSDQNIENINYLLQFTGGMACMLSFDNSEETRYNLASLRGVNQDGSMQWSILELDRSLVVTLNGKELINELQELHN